MKGAFVQKLNDYLMAKYAKFQADDEGQGVIEYVLVAGVISMALFLAFQTTGIAGQITTTVGGIVSTMAGS
jgi:Flp pilus assembly pilin Flp